MKNPRAFVETNYGLLSHGEQALTDPVLDLIRRVERLEYLVSELRKDVNE